MQRGLSAIAEHLVNVLLWYTQIYHTISHCSKT